MIENTELEFLNEASAGAIAPHPASIKAKTPGNISYSHRSRADPGGTAIRGMLAKLGWATQVAGIPEQRFRHRLDIKALLSVCRVATVFPSWRHLKARARRYLKE
jgi:hypothetical protein